jgi:hypothetical protein
MGKKRGKANVNKVQKTRSRHGYRVPSCTVFCVGERQGPAAGPGEEPGGGVSAASSRPDRPEALQRGSHHCAPGGRTYNLGSLKGWASLGS